MADVPGIDADQSYLQSADELLQHYKVDPDLGLAAAEVFQRRAQAGLNNLAETRAQPLWRLLGRQFSDVMILVLIAAALVAGLLGDLLDMLIILLIVLLNGLVVPSRPIVPSAPWLPCKPWSATTARCSGMARSACCRAPNWCQAILSALRPGWWCRQTCGC